MRSHAMPVACSIIIVNFNRGQLLKRCLDSLKRQSYRDGPVEILVVDNGSRDGSLELVRQYYPDIILLTNSENNYAKALNLGISCSSGEYIAFLNNDMVVEENWLAPLVELLKHDEHIGCVGGKVLLMDGRINSVGIDQLADFYFRDRGFGEQDRGQYDYVQSVDGITGGAVLWRRECLNDIGMVDEDYLMYFEDVDLALRCTEKNWLMVYSPYSIAHHRFRGTSAGTDVSYYFCNRNRFLLLARHFPHELPGSLLTSYFYHNNQLEWLHESIPVAVKKLYDHHPQEALQSILPEARAVLQTIFGQEKTDDLFRRIEVVLGLRRPRIGIYDHTLHKANGDKKYACLVGHLLQGACDVTYIANQPVSIQTQQASYDLDLSQCRVKIIPLPLFEEAGAEAIDSDFAPSAGSNPFQPLEEESRNYDIFINASCERRIRPKSPLSVLFYQFPDAPRGRYFAGDQYQYIIANGSHAAERLKQLWGLSAHATISAPDELTGPSITSDVDHARFRGEMTQFLDTLIQEYKRIKRPHVGDFLKKPIWRSMCMTFLSSTRITAVYEGIATYFNRKLNRNKIDSMNLKRNIYARANLHEHGASLKTELFQCLLDSSQRLETPRHEIPLVSVVIITYNKAEYTFHCLTNLLSHADVSYELIIVDNASHDETIPLLERLTNATIVKNNENCDFIHACNQGAQQAKGKYLLFLNNDAYLTHGALAALVDTMERVLAAGAVGAKLVWPTGQLQEAGSIIWRDASALGYGRGDDPDKGEYSYLREVDYCSAACLLVRKELFDRLGGFDSRYFPAYYEDSDLCMGVRDLGYRVLFQPKAVVMHHEFTSSSPGRAESLCRQNQPKFEAKWRRALVAHLSPSPANILRARDRGTGRNVLVFDDRIPTPDRGSGYPRMFAILRLLAELEYRVTFVPVLDTTKWQPETERLQQLGIEVLYGPMDLAAMLESRKTLYHMVLISRPHNAAAVMPLVCKFLPTATLIYDAEALFYQRDVLRAQLEGRRIDGKDILRLKEEELELIGTADKVITVSQREKELITRESGRHHGLFVWGDAREPYVPSTGFANRRDILFVGGFLSSPSPNEDAILHFAKNIFPKIRQELADVRLIIVGANPPGAVASLASAAVVIQGHVPSLCEHYESCRLFVVPLRYGAGISLKLIEAMSFGIPAVVTELATNGLDLQDGEQTLICHNDQEFLEKTIQLYRDESLWTKVQQGALKYIEESCDPHRMRESLRHILECSSDGAESARCTIPAARLRVVKSKAVEPFLPRSRTPWYRLPARALYYYREAGTRIILSKTYHSLRTRLPRG